MNPNEAIQSLNDIKQRALDAIRVIADTKELEETRVTHLGRKSELSKISALLREMSDEERRQVGRVVNDVRSAVESELESKLQSLQAAEMSTRLEQERVDVTLPGRKPPLGSRNPLTEVLDDIVDAFVGLGFTVAEGPEVETDYYNFQALNIPEDHPARSMWDTLYVEPCSSESSEMPLFRTHTSPMQVRWMEEHQPPVYIIVPGRVARNETLDAKHLASFIQVEGLAVDYGISFGDLAGTLDAFARSVFGPDQRIRLRPSYFPFTEPSAEVDVLCFACGGSGCRSCGREGWIELLGAGMVHPNVFKAVGYPPGITGFAFGMGIERIAMPRYGVEDIRWFYDNDLEFLGGFR
jgi:phenylalanyl-tRNA synthetase alpha chain